MKPRLLVAFLVTAAVIGGLLSLFPAEWVGLLFALIVLVTAQVILLRRHTSVLRHPPGSPPQPRVAAEAGSAPLPDAGETAASGAPPAALSPEVFSRFRAHLETMERGAGPSRDSPSGAAPAGAPAAAPAASATPDAVTDRVEISSGAKGQRAPSAASPSAESATAAASGAGVASGAGAPAATAAPGGRSKRGRGKAGAPGAPAALPPAVEEEEGPDLFADLRPALAVGAAGAPRAKNAGAPRPPAPVTDEVGQALERARDPQHLQEEGAALVRIAQDALDEGDLARARAVLEQYESLLAESPKLATWEAARAGLRLAAREQRGDAIAPAFQAMLDRGYAPVEAELESEIDGLLEGLTPEGRQAGKVALLVKALAPFRQAGDRAALDRLYERIEAAQESAGDTHRLIQFYKNHLAIKEALGDDAGRLNLIDKIGNRYYQLGDTAPAKEYYELGLKLRGEMERARPAAAPGAADRGEPADTESPLPSAAGGGESGRG